MDIIWNDYSIDGQFTTFDDFLDYLSDSFLGILKKLKELDFSVLKSYTTYTRKITNDYTLLDLLHNIDAFGCYSEIVQLKNSIVELTSSPFWEDSPKSETESVYKTNITDEFYGSTPNCFSEALERDRLILSFKHNAFMDNDISILKNSSEYSITNVNNLYNLADYLMEQSHITLSEALSVHGRAHNVEFLYNESSHYFYADEDTDSILTVEEKACIKDDFLIFLDGKKTGRMLRRLTDTINYRGVSINEFRTTISGNNEFRLFYYIKNSKYIFLCSHIKKTRTTPEYIKKRVYDLIRNYL